MTFRETLEAFASANRINTKGSLSIVLVVTDHARRMGFPLDPARLVAPNSETQVLGASGAKVQGILQRHGIDRVLSAEGGRTSRGSVQNMKAYVACLNALTEGGPLDLEAVEAFWVEKVQAFFAGKPFTLRMDASHGIRAMVRNLMEQALDRQRSGTGAMIVGTVVQHLVGAKIAVAMRGRLDVDHHGSNVNDVRARGGDFDLGDTSIHVSVSPSEALLRKCADNLADGRRPIIVTGKDGVAVAEGLARNQGIADRIDVLEVEQFIATNVYEIGKFEANTREEAISDIITEYNSIVSTVETDPSLLIDLHSRRGRA